MNRRHAAFLTGAAFLVFLFAGCGDGLYEVSGTVNVNGKPVEQGMITFYPADGQGQPAGDAIKNGQYKLKAKAGLMKVAITASKQTGTKKLYDTPGSKERPIYSQWLPAKYADPAKTELQYEVKAGPSQKDWSLTVDEP